MKIQDLASSPELIKYFTILDRHSKEFKKIREGFNKKHIHEIKNIDNVLDQILMKFFIPCTEENSTYLLACLHTKRSCDKVTFNEILVPTVLKITEPCLIIKITDMVSAEELSGFWTQYRKHTTQLKNQKLKNFDILNKIQKPHYIRKGWADIDLYLTIYRFRTEKKLSYNDIIKELRNNKEKYPFLDGRRLGYEDIGKKFRKIKKLITAL